MTRLFVIISVLLLAQTVGCGDDAAQECSTSSMCDLHPFGQCAPSPSGSMWCQYGGEFAAGCPSGLRWSEGAGEGLAMQCVDENATDPDADVPDAPVADEADADVDAALPDAGPPDAALPKTGDVDFVGHLPGMGEVNPVDVAVTSDGALVAVVGYFTTSITINGTAVNSAGSDDMFAALFSVPQKKLLWVKAFGGTGQDRLLGVAFDGNSDVLVAGRGGANIAFGGVNLTNLGNADIIIAKLANATGNVAWARDVGGTGFDEAFDAATDPAGNVIITGYYNGQVDLGGTVFNDASQTAFVAKYSGANGALSWAKAFGSTGGDSGLGIATDSTGAVLATGVYEGTTTFGNISLTSAGMRDVFVIKLASADGAVVWARSYGGTGTDRGWRVAAGGADDRVSVVGLFAGAATVGGNTFNAVGANDKFILSLSNAGNPIWARQLDADTGEFYGDSIAVDKQGRTLLAGRYQSGTDFGLGPVAAISGTDLYLVRYLAASGMTDFVRHFGSVGADAAMGVTADGASRPVAVAYFQDSIMLDKSMLSSEGTNRDGLVFRVLP